MVIFNRYKIVTAGFEKASKKLIHTGLREIGSFTSLSAKRKKLAERLAFFIDREACLCACSTYPLNY